MATGENSDALADFRGRIATTVAEHGTRELIKLTDEELSVLDPVPSGQLVATPHLDNLTESQRQVAVATAIRTLVAHGTALVTNANEVREAIRADANQQVAVALRATGLVEMVLALRGTADYLVIAELHAAASAGYGYFYVRGPGAVLREEVNGGGMHSYAAVSPGDVPTQVREFLDPLCTARDDGPHVELSPDALENHEAGPLNAVLESAVNAGRLTFVSSEGNTGPLLLTYATSEGLWAVRVSQPGAPVVAQRVSPDTLDGLIAEILQLAGVGRGEWPTDGGVGRGEWPTDAARRRQWVIHPAGQPAKEPEPQEAAPQPPEEPTAAATDPGHGFI